MKKEDPVGWFVLFSNHAHSCVADISLLASVLFISR